MDNKDKYGIKMRKFCAEHEEAVRKELAEKGASQKLLDRHLEKLRWLQHERLIQLIVLLLTVMCELFALYLAFVALKTVVAFAVSLVILVVLFFYVLHYFFLENTTQHWYRIAEEIMDGLDK